MAKTTLALLLLLSAAGCTLLENDLAMGRPRFSNERSGNDADSVNNIKSPEEPAGPRHTADTAVFISAVRCGPGYDWKRDSAYGCPSAEILLIRDGETVVSIPVESGSCVSAAPDRHHILDGHLYTEFCDYSQTVIGRDGQELYRVSGREQLKGLCVKGEDLFTLSERLDSKGIVLRKNGEAVLSKADADAFGGFDDPSYGQTGALYEDGGHICFAFKIKKENSVTCHMARDGNEESVPGAGAGTFDLKSVSNRNIAVSSSALGHKWKDAHIWRNGDSYLVAGESADDDSGRLYKIVDAKTRQSTAFKMDGAVIYYKNGASLALDTEEMERDNYCFSTRCAAILGTELITLHTPKDGSAPFLMEGGVKTEFRDLEGYLTGVTADISLPKLNLSPHPQR